MGKKRQRHESPATSALPRLYDRTECVNTTRHMYYNCFFIGQLFSSTYGLIFVPVFTITRRLVEVAKPFFSAATHARIGAAFLLHSLTTFFFRDLGLQAVEGLTMNFSFESLYPEKKSRQLLAKPQIFLNLVKKIKTITTKSN